MTKSGIVAGFLFFFNNTSFVNYDLIIVWKLLKIYKIVFKDSKPFFENLRYFAEFMTKSGIFSDIWLFLGHASFAQNHESTFGYRSGRISPFTKKFTCLPMASRKLAKWKD